MHATLILRDDLFMDPVTLLQDLVAIPSVNPMGRPLTGPEYFEGRLSDYLENFFRKLNVPYLRQQVHPGRDNVIARFDRPGSRATIVMDAHQDTVPVDGMTIPPFQPEVRGGKLYGRGSCDVKGGLAAMLSAFARLVREQPAQSASVVMSCTCDEEEQATGARALASLWSDPAKRTPLMPVPPSMILVAEPTDLHVVVAHRGAVRWKIRTRGRACHSSRPDQGENAVYKMAQVVSCLERYAAELPNMVPAHPLCGTATLSVGVISGGISVNTVPDECLIEIDRRTLPGEKGADIIPHVDAYLRERLDVDFEMLPPWCHGENLSDEHNGEWADRLLRHVAAVAGPREKVGVAYGTNASRMVTNPPVPAVVFGPGSIHQAHTLDEWIDINELQLASEIYFRFCASEG